MSDKLLETCGWTKTTPGASWDGWSSMIPRINHLPTGAICIVSHVFQHVPFVFIFFGDLFHLGLKGNQQRNIVALELAFPLQGSGQTYFLFVPPLKRPKSGRNLTTPIEKSCNAHVALPRCLGLALDDDSRVFQKWATPKREVSDQKEPHVCKPAGGKKLFPDGATCLKALCLQ